MNNIPSFFPLYDFAEAKLLDGNLVPACSFCKKHAVKYDCVKHYAVLKTKPEGFYQCPSGFTSRTFFFHEQFWAITGIVAFPRFGSEAERAMAKRFPETKAARADVDSVVALLNQIDRARADAIQEGAKVLPQAFHELRKLNGAILQHAEKELREGGSSPALRTIMSAAELMRNNFDILEALANIDGMRALPVDSTINLFDLAYKTKRVLQERATNRGIQLSVTGDKAIVPGSQKSFPIVPAVLLLAAE